MTAANQQIIECYELLGMAPEQIAEDQDIDISIVKSILCQFSSVYRKAAKKDSNLDFSDDELVRANQVISELAQYAEDERTRLRAAIYVRDDKKGRLDVIKQMTGLNINVLMMEDAMKKAITASKRAKGELVNCVTPEGGEQMDNGIIDVK